MVTARKNIRNLSLTVRYTGKCVLGKLKEHKYRKYFKVLLVLLVSLKHDSRKWNVLKALLLVRSRIHQITHIQTTPKPEKVMRVNVTIDLFTDSFVVIVEEMNAME